MNYAIVFRLLGYVLMIEGALLLLPAAASLVYGEWMVLGVFLLTAAVSAGIGYALHTIKSRSKVFYMREGFAATSRRAQQGCAVVQGPRPAHVLCQRRPL